MYIEVVVVKDIIAHSLLVITRRYIHPTLKKKTLCNYVINSYN